MYHPKHIITLVHDILIDETGGDTLEVKEFKIIRNKTGSLSYVFTKFFNKIARCAVRVIG